MQESLGIVLFHFGSTDVTVGLSLTALGIVVATMLAGRIAGWATHRYFRKGRDDDAQAARAFGVAANFLVWFIGFELLLHLLGIRLGSVLAAFTAWACKSANSSLRRRETISARILTAISSGSRALISIPAGTRTRSRSDLSNPSPAKNPAMVCHFLGLATSAT